MFSLSSLAQALQGELEDSKDEELEEGQAEDDDEKDAGAGHSEDADEDDEGEAPQFSFWGVATALTATVKAKTAKVLSAVQEVDWREELEAFQQGAKEDAEAVGKGADVVMHKAMEAAEQLPTNLEHLPVNTAVLQARAEAATAAARAQAGRSLAGLAGLGSKLVLSTHDLLEQINHAVHNEMALTEEANSTSRRISSSKALAGQGRYSRFEADVAAMQRDSSTYCDEPEDVDEFEAWLAGFDLAVRKPDVDHLIAENTFMSELQARIVPLIVEYNAFWTRYFYRLHKLELKHQQFLQLAQRAQQQEEEVGWSSDEEAEQGQRAVAAAASGRQVVAAATGGGARTHVSEEAPKRQEEEKEEVAASSAQHSPAAAAVTAVRVAGTESDIEPHEELSAGSPGSAGSKAHGQAVSAHWHSASGSPSDEAAALSSDSDHWQVVRSPCHGQLATAGGEQQKEPGAAADSAAVAQADKVAVAESAGETASAAEPTGDSQAAAADAAPHQLGAAAPNQQAGAAEVAEDEELSDWGEDDEAVLASAAGAGGKAGDNADEEAWGSDWE